MISDTEKEVLVFFSFSCTSCHSGLVAMSYAEKKVDGYFQKIPFVNNNMDTHKSAALFFMMKLTQPTHKLTDAEILDVGFQLYPRVKDEPFSADIYLMLFREYGMEISMFDFLKAWEATHVMMGSAKEMTNQLATEKEGMPLPLFRITHENVTRFWSPDFNEVTLKEFTDTISDFKGE